MYFPFLDFGEPTGPVLDYLFSSYIHTPGVDIQSFTAEMYNSFIPYLDVNNTKFNLKPDLSPEFLLLYLTAYPTSPFDYLKFWFLALTTPHTNLFRIFPKWVNYNYSLPVSQAKNLGVILFEAINAYKNLANNMRQNNRDSIRYNSSLCNNVWCTSAYNVKRNNLNYSILSYSIPFQLWIFSVFMHCHALPWHVYTELKLLIPCAWQVPNVEFQCSLPLRCHCHLDSSIWRSERIPNRTLYSPTPTLNLRLSTPFQLNSIYLLIKSKTFVPSFTTLFLSYPLSNLSLNPDSSFKVDPQMGPLLTTSLASDLNLSHHHLSLGYTNNSLTSLHTANHSPCSSQSQPF